ncbi:hypothetical protein HRbin30_03048 [bacterium HR30]|nr:hypothetical protein HRbin30_03048 [bacterium HR30]
MDFHAPWGVAAALFFSKVCGGVDARNRISTGSVWCCARRILSGWTWGQSLAWFVCLVFAGLTWAQTTVESFESLEGWTTHASQNAHVELALDEGVVGKSLRVDFDIQPGGSFVIVRKPVRLKLPKNYVFKLWIRGQGAPNDLQFKLVDPSGRNVWWYRQRPCHFPADWRQLAIRDARVEFAWGDAPAAQPAEIGFIEFAIAAGTGGRGSLWLDELTWEPRKAMKGRMPRPRVEASTSVPGSEAEAVLDTDPNTAWRSGVLAAKQWLQIDFQAPQEYGAIVIDWDPVDYAVVYRVLASADGEHWWSLFASEHGNGGRDYIPTGEAESRWIRIEMEQSSRGQGYAIRSLTVKPYELAASPNVFFGTLASEAPPGLYPRYFVPEQVYWTAVAPPSGGRQALLSSDGAIEPVAGGYSVEPFVYRNGSLFSWKQVQTVPLSNEAMVPIPRVAWEHEWFRLEVETFAGGTDTAHAFFARYELQNRLPEQAEFSLFLAVRPFQVLPPWQNLNLVGGVSSIRELAFDSRTIWIDRKPAIVVQSPGARFGAAYFEEGMVTESLARGSLPPRVQIADPLGYASGALEYKMTLSPGQKSAVYLAFPWDAAGVGELQLATDGAEVAYRQQLERARESWQRQLGRVEFELPDGASDIEATLRSAMAHILMNQRGAALQPGPRTYARAWIRDGVTMATALLQLGATAEPRAFVRWFAQYQLPDGRIPCCVDWRGADPVPEHDSNGEFLFLVAEYYRFTRDVGLVAELWPQIQAAVDWIERARAQRMTDLYRTGDKRLFYGLLPESISHEGYAARPVHSYWDDFWALRGLEDAARLATVVGDLEAAARWALLRDDFRSTLVASLLAVAERHKLDYLPASVELADFDPNSTAIALYPVDVLAALPREAVERTFERYWAIFQARLEGKEPWDSYTPYELRNVPALVRLGKREQALEVLTALMRDRRPLPWRQWSEIIWRDPQWPRFIGDMPHAWVSALFIESVRHLFAYERAADASLVVGAGLPPDWIQAGVGFRRLPTHYGTLHFRAQVAESSNWTIYLGGDLQMPPGKVVLRLPFPKALREVQVNGRTSTDFDRYEVRISEIPAEVELSFAAEESS